VQDALRDGNAEVLVQGDKPVPLWSFLEERALHSDSCRLKKCGDSGMRLEGNSKLLAARQVEQVARARTIATTALDLTS